MCGVRCACEALFGEFQYHRHSLINFPIHCWICRPTVDSREKFRFNNFDWKLDASETNFFRVEAFSSYRGNRIERSIVFWILKLWHRNCQNLGLIWCFCYIRYCSSVRWERNLHLNRYIATEKSEDSASGTYFQFAEKNGWALNWSWESTTTHYECFCTLTSTSIKITEHSSSTFWLSKMKWTTQPSFLNAMVLRNTEIIINVIWLPNKINHKRKKYRNYISLSVTPNLLFTSIS